MTPAAKFERLMALENAANRYLKEAGRRVLDHPNGDNSDIQTTVVNAANRYHNQAAAFAKATRTGNKLEDCAILWRFAKNYIRYSVDPDGWQFIQSPGALWKSKLGDCKSFTVFTSSVLRWWGIPHVIRFTSKDADPSAPFTHVYVVALINGQRVPVDPVWEQFGTEHEHAKEKDFEMKVATISGALKGVPPKMDLANMTEAELSLQIHRQRLALKKEIAKKRNIPRLTAAYARQIQQTDNLIKATQKGPDAVDAAIDDISVGGIGSIDGPKKKNPNKPPRLEKLGEKIKKAAGKALKVVTAPARLVGKAAMEVMIPKSAVFFKYLFVTKPDMIQRMPSEARKKRKKAEEVAKFITEGLGMKTEHFMGLVRNGILKNEGMEPEALLAKELGGKVSGIGMIEDAIKVLVELIKKISALLGKKGPNVGKEDFPDASKDGFGAPGTSAATSWANDIKKGQPDDLDGGQDGGGPSGGPRKSIC